jgi:intein/homing endonuclease
MADPNLPDQIEAFLRNALSQKRLEDELVQDAVRALRQTLVGIQRTLDTSGIMSPGPRREEQIRRLVTAVANSVQRSWGVPQLEVLQEALTPYFAQQLEFARQMVELSGGALSNPGAVAASQGLVNQAINQAVVGGKTLADTLRISVPLMVSDRMERLIRLGMSDLGGELVTYADAVVRTTSNNVEAIIRTGVHEVGSAAQMAIYEVESDPDWLGEDGLVWTATLDSAVCPICLGLDGKRYQFGAPGPYWDGRAKISPHMNCVLGSTRIKAGAVLAAARAKYSGQVVTISTKGGRRLAVTENHPVLTAEGWKPAKLVNQGDQLICDHAPDIETGINPDLNQGPPTAEQLFALALQQPGVEVSAVPASPVDFHGDGAGLDGKVDVVRINRELLFHGQPASPEPVGHALFVGTDVALLPVASLGPLDALLLAMHAAATGFMSVPGLVSTLLGSHPLPLEGLGLALSARRDPRFDEPVADAAPGDAHLLRHLVLAHPGAVETDDLHNVGAGLGPDGNTGTGEAVADALHAASVELRELAQAHPGLVELDDVLSVQLELVVHEDVYDFSTLSGAYFADDILTHNCRCYVLPHKWRNEDMISPKGKKVEPKRPTEGDRGEGALSFKAATVDWIRANPETTRAIFGKRIGDQLLGSDREGRPVKRISLDRAVKLWQAPAS